MQDKIKRGWNYKISEEKKRKIIFLYRDMVENRKKYKKMVEEELKNHPKIKHPISVREIAEEMRVSYQAVYSFISKYKQNGDIG